MRYALGDAQRDVLDSIRTLGPCTTAQLTAHTGRADVSRIVGSLVRRRLLFDYGSGRFDVPCDSDMLGRVKSHIRANVCLYSRDRDALGYKGRLCDHNNEYCEDDMGTHPPDPKTPAQPPEAVRRKCAELLGAHDGVGWDVIAFLLQGRINAHEHAKELLRRFLESGDDRKTLQEARAFLEDKL